MSWAWRFSRDSQPAYLYAGWLGEGDESRRILAAQELGGETENGPLAIANLVHALVTDKAVAVRKASAQSLGHVASKGQDNVTIETAVRGLFKALSDTDPAVRAAAADALGQIAPEPNVAVPALLLAANDRDEWVRGAAIAAIGLIQGKAKVDRKDVRLAIAAAMTDSSLHVRELGTYAFWATAENSPDLSRDFLRDNNTRVRLAAVRGVARSVPLAENVTLELNESLHDPDAAVRAAAEHALANAGEAATVE